MLNKFIKFGKKQAPQFEGLVLVNYTLNSVIHILYSSVIHELNIIILLKLGKLL